LIENEHSIIPISMGVTRTYEKYNKYIILFKFELLLNKN